jgi:hypothetical protein
VKVHYIAFYPVADANLKTADMKGFITYFAGSTLGQIDPNGAPSKLTLHSALLSFFSAWVRRSGKSFPKDMRQQFIMDSPELTQLVPLSTTMQQKPIADLANVTILQSLCWSDMTHFRHLHEHIQFGAIVQLQALTGE